MDGFGPLVRLQVSVCTSKLLRSLDEGSIIDYLKLVMHYKLLYGATNRM
jgi:hypothetical protein